MSAPRKIGEVIERILAVIPESETALRGELGKVSGKAWFTAPEAMRRVWGLLCAVLADALPLVPAEEWQAKVGRIVRAEE